MLAHTDFLDALRLKPQEAIDLLDDRRDSAADAERGERYRRPGVPMLVRHPTGEQARYLVFTDRLWAGGLTALHGGYLHPGVAAQVSLETAAEPMRIDAGVVHCSHLRGRVHMLELAFETALQDAQLRSLAAPSPSSAGPTAPEVDPESLEGSVLHVEHSELDHRLLMHHMSRTRIAVHRASSGAKAIAHLREAKVDAVLCGLELGDTTGEALIARMREAHYDGPVAVVTGVKDSARLKAAVSAGACDVLLKPFQPERLFQSLGRMLRPAAGTDARAGVSDGVLRRSARIDARTLRKSISDLPGAIVARNYDEVELHCRRLRDAADRLGVPDITDAAAEVLDALQRSGSVVGAASELRALLDRCQAQIED